MNIRKTAVYMESAHTQAPGDPAVTGGAVRPPIRRAYAAAVLDNPCLGPNGLESGEEIGALLGKLLTEQLLEAMNWTPGTTLAYGKAAIVGLDGSTEHAAAILHPRMGKPLRALIGQGKAIIPSTAKRGQPGTQIDIPLHGADDEWDFALMDAMEAVLADAPLPHEVVVFIALAQGGRAGALNGLNDDSTSQHTAA